MITKKPSPKGKSVRVTFALPADAAHTGAAVVGDFNAWQAEKGKMVLDAKRGTWQKAVSLKPGATYAFRYLIDGTEWRNDDGADGYVPNEFFGENGIIKV